MMRQSSYLRKLTPTAAHWREGRYRVVVTDADLFSMDIEIPLTVCVKWRIDASGWTGIAFGNVRYRTVIPDTGSG